MRIPEHVVEASRYVVRRSARHTISTVVLSKREERKRNLFVIAIIVLSIFILLIATYLITLRYQRKHAARLNPRRTTTRTSKQDKLPSLFSWKTIQRRLKQPRRNDYSTSLQDDDALDRNESREMAPVADPERQSGNTPAGVDSNGINTTAGVDRNTSVRSVMTLPAYSPAARENERVLAREGERGGIDTVVEFPETHDEEESRRDGEMESLYQIRLARRREATEREARRQARREARARGDMTALAEIRRRAEIAAEESLSQVLIAEHQGANRDRRVSSVQYGDLGVARHDGTRLRANSSESDVRPLLDSAASISGMSTHSRNLSTTNTLHTHYRGPSVSSIVSSRASDDFEFPDAPEPAYGNTTYGSRTGSRTGSRAATPRISHETSSPEGFEVISLGNSRTRSRSASRAASRVATPNLTPITSVEIPHEDAPAYEDPPNYESPVDTRAPQLPHLDRLPSIQVTTEPTPVDGRSVSPNPRR